MFTKEFALWISQNKFPEDCRDCAEWIIEQVPEDGILKMTRQKISELSGFSRAQVAATLKAMKNTKPVPLVCVRRDALVFDYPEKDVNYVRHLRQALSNSAWFHALDPSDEDKKNSGSEI